MANRATGQAFDITLTVVGRHSREQQVTVNPLRFLCAADRGYAPRLQLLHFDDRLQLRVTTAELHSSLACRAEIMRDLAAAFVARLHAEESNSSPN